MDVISLQRKIHNVMLVAYIEKRLYIENLRFFDCLFSTFISCDPMIEYENALFILPSENKHFFNQSMQYKIICDTSNKNWGLHLIGLLEDWYASTLKCTIIHGSCVLLNNKGILIIGKRKSGKTTLTGFLTIQKKATYLDDDCVYIASKEYVGFNMPISLRDNCDGLKRENIIGEFIDGEKINRQLFQANKNTRVISKIDIILFPYFNKEGVNRILPIKKSDLYNQILTNIRNSKDSRTIFTDISNLIRNSKAYQIAYTNSENAFQLIKSIT